MIERTIEIEAPIETVFEVISDLEKYPEFLSTTKSVAVRKVNDGIEADFAINLIKDIRYTLKFELKAPTELRWSFVSGELMKSNSGAWELEKLSSTRTRAKYSIEATFGWMVPKSLVEQVTKLQLPETLDAFRKRAEEIAERG